MKADYTFINKNNFRYQDNLFIELKDGLWKQYNIESHIKNSTVPANQPHKILSVFNDYIIIPPGTYYDLETNTLKEDLYSPKIIQMDKYQLYKIFENYFSTFNNKRIAVHLSGGLDSSIIIGLLNHFKIQFSLVGLVSNRFEFRTERTVQEILAPLGKNTILLDMDDYPSFSNLSNRKLSQVPDDNNKQVEGSIAVARACKEVADVVFTGQGGDTVFADAIPNHPIKWTCNILNEFIPCFETTHIYPDEGVELISPFADKDIINAIYSLRIGLKYDPSKKWARNYFKEILPQQLTEFNYSADFFGTSLSGLELAKPEIADLFNTAYEMTHHNIFSKKSIHKLHEYDVLDFEYQDYISYCNRISLAVWYNSLKREGYVQ